MNFRIVDRKIDSRTNQGHWTGQGLFYALCEVYVKTVDGKIYDLEGWEVSLPNDTIVYPLEIVAGGA